jgi:hypothetical protein
LLEKEANRENGSVGGAVKLCWTYSLGVVELANKKIVLRFSSGEKVKALAILR